MTKPKHILGISGGKDSAALAIYLHDKFPKLDIEYYFTDTGKELQETLDVIQRLENYLGKGVKKMVAEEAAKNTSDDPFDHFLKMYRGYLPSSTARWCTKKLKLEPFENYVGDFPTLSYVGIREDENREGYISKKSTIQSIFPFRRNIWSEEVTNNFLKLGASNILDRYAPHLKGKKLDRLANTLQSDLGKSQIISEMLDIGIVEFNYTLFDWLKTTNYPIATEDYFPLLDKTEGLVKEDIFNLLRNSNVGVPKYYDKIAFEVNGEKGEYSRSRSGCYFCFFQQRIEWVWLYEQHPDLFEKAMKYEDEEKGFTWSQNESLRDLIEPKRILAIKEQYLIRKNRDKPKSNRLLDILDNEDDGCVACFV